MPHLFEAKYRTGPPCYNKILGKQAVWKLPGDVGLMKEILVKFNYVKLWHEEAGSAQQAGSAQRRSVTADRQDMSPATPLATYSPSDTSLSLKSRCHQGNVIMKIFCTGN